MLIRILLFPFSVLLDLITRFRNHLYNIGVKPSASFDVPLVVVGNLSVGGTGKTPMIEYLIRMLLPLKVATLSRGYKRKTKGFRVASGLDNAHTLGDEPYQLFSKFGDKVLVAVGEDRALSVPFLLNHDPGLQYILLDDAYQHRRVRPSLAILLTDFHHPFFQDYLLPAGRLRESRKGASRADCIIVTKCPGLIGENVLQEIEEKIRKYATCPVFFAGIKYGDPVPCGISSKVSKDLVLVTGIADPTPLANYLSMDREIQRHFVFSDHHLFTRKDVDRFAEACKEDMSILTTEKDMVRLMTSPLKDYVVKLPLFYLPMEMYFLKNGEEFEAMVKNQDNENTN